MTSEQSSDVASGTRALRLPWRRALPLAFGVLYGPQLLMCLYTQVWVTCSHCKKAVWCIAPVAPGLFVAEWSRILFHWQHLSNGLGFAVAGVLSALTFAGLAAWLRCAGRWRIVVLILTLPASGFLAVTILGLIRA